MLKVRREAQLAADKRGGKAHDFIHQLIDASSEQAKQAIVSGSNFDLMNEENESGSGASSARLLALEKSVDLMRKDLVEVLKRLPLPRAEESNEQPSLEAQRPAPVVAPTADGIKKRRPRSASNEGQMNGSFSSSEGNQGESTTPGCSRSAEGATSGQVTPSSISSGFDSIMRAGSGFLADSIRAPGQVLSTAASQAAALGSATAGRLGIGPELPVQPLEALSPRRNQSSRSSAVSPPTQAEARLKNIMSLADDDRNRRTVHRRDAPIRSASRLSGGGMDGSSDATPMSPQVTQRNWLQGAEDSCDSAGEAQAAAMRPDRMDDRPPARPRSASTPRMSERRSSEKSANRSYNL